MAPSDPKMLAGALMKPPPAPLGAAQPQRSKYLAQALESMNKGGQNVQSGGELAARLLAQAITQRGYSRASEREAAAEQERAVAMAEAAYPGDPRAQALFLASPDAMIAAAAKGYEPQVMSQGQTLRQPGGDTYTAPIMGVDGGFGYTQTPEQVQWGAQRGVSHGEAESQRSNMTAEQQREMALRIQQQNANTTAAAHAARLAAGGYGTPGVGGAGFLGPQLDPNEWEIVQ